MQTKTTIKCLCGREVTLEIEGGQYQNTYRGDCECGRKWCLEELSEVLAEISDVFDNDSGKNKLS